MVVERKYSSIDIIFYAAIFTFLLWIVLKSFNIINTPTIIDMVPYFSAAVIFGVFFEKLNRAGKDIVEIKNEIKGYRETDIPKVHDIDKRVAVLESKNKNKKK